MGILNVVIFMQKYYHQYCLKVTVQGFKISTYENFLEISTIYNLCCIVLRNKCHIHIFTFILWRKGHILEKPRQSVTDQFTKMFM